MVLRLVQGLLGLKRTSSRVEVIADHVWLSREAKLAGIRRELRDRTVDGARMIALVAHFPDVLDEMQQIASQYAGSASVRPVLSRELSSGAAGDLPLAQADLVDLIAAERHPLAPMDDALIEFAEALPCRCRIVYHISLDDPILRFVGAESIRATLDRLGATEDEALTHDMITRSIRRAQQKIASRSTDRLDAESAAEWIERNVRE
jgi:hypothetical protein